MFLCYYHYMLIKTRLRCKVILDYITKQICWDSFVVAYLCVIKKKVHQYRNTR